MNLMVHQEHLNLHLQPLEMQIVKASDDKKIIDLSIEELVSFASKLISFAMTLLGHKNTFQNEEERSLIEVNLIQQLKIQAPYFTKKEIELAIQVGFLGDISKSKEPIVEYFSIAGIMKCIAAYKAQKDEVAAKVLAQKRKAQQAEAERIAKQKSIDFLKNVFIETLDYVISNNNQYIEFKEEYHYYPAFSTLAEIVLEAEIYYMPPDARWNILLEERQKLLQNVTHFELTWRPKQFAELKNAWQEKRKFQDNYFDIASIEKAKVRIYKDFIVELSKKQPNEQSCIKLKLFSLIEEKKSNNN
ncbi:MAG: hypothetical protein OHK0045_22890 [Raineya sp.]